MSLRLPKCDFCKHFHEDKLERSCCDAFPEGIPWDKISDDESEECANGIKFEPE